MFKRVTGTKDILPAESSAWLKIEEISHRVFSFYNYRQIRTPLIEEADLFRRSLGGAAEIVQKQMFLLRNKDDHYALRPEGTASIARAYLENNLDKTGGLQKFYYYGPMFRREKPQKGRLRQFHHLGCEAIGSSGPDIDIEVLSLAQRLLEAWAINDFTFRINSLGCSNDQKGRIRLLRRQLAPRIDKFCADCRLRFKQNILRIMDCRKESCQEQIRKLGVQDQHLCSDCQMHFSSVKEGLAALNINYAVSTSLVRGLDYYTRTVFEITHPCLGAQDALGAGGRYDNLIQQLGGSDVGAIGFAFGIERLLLAGGHRPQETIVDLVYLVTLGREAGKGGGKLLDSLRGCGISADMGYEKRSLKGALRRANVLGARYVLILGEDELKKGVVTLKDMQSGMQEEINLSACAESIKRRLKSKNSPD